MLEEIRNHPLFAKVMSRGEEGIGKVVAQVLSDERVTTGIQGFVESTQAARRQIERGIRHVLHAFQIPTLEEIETIREKIGEIEAIVSELAERKDKDRRQTGRPNGETG
jgi:hypothetical protein